jgi:hypothetical protein
MKPPDCVVAGPLEISVLCAILCIAQAVAIKRCVFRFVCQRASPRQTDWSAWISSFFVRGPGFKEPVMSDLFFTTDLLGEFDRLQRQIASAVAGFPASLRATRSETFPPVNVGSTDDSVEIVAFAPGLDPASIDVSIDKGLLRSAANAGLPRREVAMKLACTLVNASWDRSGA